jgi:hypothetical protein
MLLKTTWLSCMNLSPRGEWHLLKLLLGHGGKRIVAARMSHQGVGFWAAFFDTGFGAIRAEGDEVVGEDLEDVVEESGLFARPV